MPHIRPLNQLTPREHETLKVMDVLAEFYPDATGDWELDSRSPIPVAPETARAPVRRDVREQAVREPVGHF